MPIVLYADVSTQARQRRYTVGAAKKLDGGAAAKGVLTDAGLVSLQYSQDLRAKTTGVFSCQFDLKKMDKGAKAGIELKVKA